MGSPQTWSCATADQSFGGSGRLAGSRATLLEAHPDVERADRADAASLRRPLFDALSRLNARDRDVLLLVAWEALSYQEVAAALDIPVGTVRSRQSCTKDAPLGFGGLRRGGHLCLGRAFGRRDRCVTR
jgi:hypothetical protein